MLGQTRQRSKTVSDDNPYWISFSDLMTGLLVIFILAAVSLIIELTQKTENIDESIQELKKAEKDRNDVIQEIKEELAKRGIVVLVADNDTVIRIPESTLTFGSGQDELPGDPEIISNVRMIGEILYTALTRFDRLASFDTIFIEGHTDSDNFWQRKGNWGLSSDRAISVWNAWTDKELGQPGLLELTNEMGQKLFSVSGYASTRRVNTIEATPEDKAQNRRIDIRFTVKRPSIENYEAIKAIGTTRGAEDKTP